MCPASVIMARKNGAPEDQVYAGDILVAGETSASASTLTTVGAGTILASLIASGVVKRSGPTGAYTDTTDSAANILAAIAGNAPYAGVSPGHTFRLLYKNTVAEAMTLAAGAGVILGDGTTSLIASAVREYLFKIRSLTLPKSILCNVTSGSAVVTFVLPPNSVALGIGPSSPYNDIGYDTFISDASNTNIPASTTVIGVTDGQGGIIGVTMSANATGTATEAVNFGPTLQIDGLWSGSL